MSLMRCRHMIKRRAWLFLLLVVEFWGHCITGKGSTWQVRSLVSGSSIGEDGERRVDSVGLYKFGDECISFLRRTAAAPACLGNGVSEAALWAGGFGGSVFRDLASVPELLSFTQQHFGGSIQSALNAAIVNSIEGLDFERAKLLICLSSTECMAVQHLSFLVIIDSNNLVAIRAFVQAGILFDAGDSSLTKLAAYNGHLRVFACLHEAGSNIHCEEETPLLIAIREKHDDIIDYILTDASPTVKNMERLLLEACRSGAISTVLRLLSCAEALTVISQSSAALSLASEENMGEIVYLLLKSGASIPEGQEGDELFQRAIDAGATQAIYQLVGGGYIMSSNDNGSLRGAISLNNAGLVEFFFEEGVVLYSRDEEDGSDICTILRDAIGRGAREIARLLLCHHFHTPEAFEAVFLACIFDQDEACIDLMLQERALDIESASQFLKFAIEGRHDRSIVAILSRIHVFDWATIAPAATSAVTSGTEDATAKVLKKGRVDLCMLGYQKEASGVNVVAEIRLACLLGVTAAADDHDECRECIDIGPSPDRCHLQSTSIAGPLRQLSRTDRQVQSFGSLFCSPNRSSAFTARSPKMVGGEEPRVVVPLLLLSEEEVDVTNGGKDVADQLSSADLLGASLGEDARTPCRDQSCQRCDSVLYFGDLVVSCTSCVRLMHIKCPERLGHFDDEDGGDHLCQYCHENYF